MIPCVPTEAESYGYCQGQVVDLGPVMPAVQFYVTEERVTYLCTVRALVFEGSILMYNPTLMKPNGNLHAVLLTMCPGLRRGQRWPWLTMTVCPSGGGKDSKAQSRPSHELRQQ